MELNANVPRAHRPEVVEAPLRHEARQPANKRKYSAIVVGSASRRRRRRSLGELGYNVKCFCYQDSARRAHSIAAQGGINAAKNYQNDGDSVWRLFYDTVKAGTTAPARRTSTASRAVGEHHRSVRGQGVPFPASTAAPSPTARSAGRSSPARSTPAARPASSSSSAPTRP